MIDSPTDLAHAAATDLAAQLSTRQRKIVFAESCTAGMAAALLGGCPGISAWLCGSAVTYREATKTQWLDIEPTLLKKFSAESSEATHQMAEAVLKKTPEANLAAAITGHLGPQAPPAIDGKIFMAISIRRQNKIDVNHLEVQLEQTDRRARQLEAATQLLTYAKQILSSEP